MYRRALNRNVFSRITTANRTVFTPRTIVTAVNSNVKPVQSVSRTFQGVRYSSGMSALNEAQNPQVGEGLEGQKGGKAQVIDGNAIAK